MTNRTYQVAALPWRIGDRGVEFLLVTTRTTKRWVIPKGWTMDGKADHEAAAIEAYEEAGVNGTMNATTVGTYSYVKILRNGTTRFLRVNVYALQVKDVLDDWPERAERDRQWVSKQQAVEMIGEAELLPVIVAFDESTHVAVAASNVNEGMIARIKKWWRKLLA